MNSIILLLIFALCAQAADLIPRRGLFGNAKVTAPQISPDGKILAYLAPVNGVRNVYVRTIDRTDDRPATSERHRDLSSYFWRGTSRHILYVQDTDGNENFHLFQTEILTGMTRDLTPFDGVMVQIVSVRPEFPDSILVALNRRDRRVFDVHRLNLETGELTLESENPGGITAWHADNTQKIRAAVAQLPDGSQEVRLRAGPQSAWKPFRKFGPDEPQSGIAGFRPDGRALWLRTGDGANTTRLLEVDVQTGTSTVLAEDPIFDVGDLIINPRTGEIDAVSIIGERMGWRFFNRSLEAQFAILKRQKRGEAFVVSRTANDDKRIIVLVGDTSPASYHLCSSDTRRCEFLFSSRPELDKYRLADMRPIAFKARDGMKIYGYLTEPAGRRSGMVMLVHGGPWSRDVWGYAPLVQLLTSRGYSVLQLNFRGSSGYGKQYLSAGDREWAGKMHDDLIDGKRWAVKHGHADASKVAIMGSSYGGYAALVSLGFAPGEFACGIASSSPSNLVTLLKNIPPYWTPLKTMLSKRIGNVETEESFLLSHSPISRVDRIQKPLMIVQGGNDVRVKRQETDALVKALRDIRKEVEYIVFPDEGHNFARPNNQMRFLAATESFLGRCLGGSYEPAEEAERWDSFRQ